MDIGPLCDSETPVWIDAAGARRSTPPPALPGYVTQASSVLGPLDSTIAQRFVADRVALVGDAAHGIHPIAGQGLNAGMRDVAALVEVLATARARGEDIGSAQVLGRYQQWRRFDTATLALATDAFNKLFSNDLPPVRRLRELGMGVVNALPGLRKSFMREAAGLTGDLPRLLLGERV